MAKYISSALLKAAVDNIESSAAKDRYFEFLMLKRVFTLSETNSVAFSEGEPAYKQAINELGLVSLNAAEASRFINVFDIRDKKHGYRNQRFISNGPNTTVGGTPWQSIVKFDNQSRPRKVSLALDYANYIEAFLIQKNKSKPDFRAFSIWFCRHLDIQNDLFVNDFNSNSILNTVVNHTEKAFGFTKEEKTALFGEDSTFFDSVAALKGSAVNDELTNPADYLPSNPSVDNQDKVSGVAVDANHSLSRIPYDQNTPSQKIYFGSPGAGKSRKAEMDTSAMKPFRTTFHPDTDYASFVGAYKPTIDEHKNVSYGFVPQVFTKAYSFAWNNPDTVACLIIEEINRGNCAQIFGDLFQLLDRDPQTGYSRYALHADTDLQNYLSVSLADVSGYTEAVGGSDQLKLPPNFYIYATMNTSDQSLFPMDSAFKRRWDWEYVPIDYTDADQFIIDLGKDYMYKWGRFIECVNRHIVELTGSEDKQLGNRFVNPPDKVITKEVFKSKIIFYLWSEIYKNERDSPENIFVYQPAYKPDVAKFSFSQLYQKQSDGAPFDDEILPSFMRQLGLDPTRE